MSPDSAQRDVVLALGFITWADGEPERGVASAIVARHLLGALLDDPRIGRVLVANPFRSAPARLLKRRHRAEREGFPQRADTTLVQPLRLSRRDPLAIPRALRAYRRYDQRLAAAARRSGLERPLVITSSPLVAGFAPLEWAAHVTYYARDDYPAAHSFGQRRNRPLFHHAYERMRAQGRAVAAVSQPILDQVATPGPSLVVPNAVDPRYWRALPEPSGEILALPGPRVLYVGGLDRRLDVSALEEVADRLARGSLVLVGPLLDASHLESLRRRPNVHVLPPRGRSELPALVAASDVGVLPYGNDRATTGMSPLKLYEYLSAGLPVAASDLPAMRGVSDRVALARRGEPFTETVERALAAGRATERERLDFVAGNSWRERHRTLIEFVLAGAPSANHDPAASHVPAVLAASHPDDRELHGVAQLEGRRGTLTH